MDDFVIRLWNRVGKVRAISAVAILAALLGGLVIANRLTQHDASASPAKAAGAAFPLSSSSATPSASHDPVNIDEADALAKAKDAASDASAEAKAADDEARKKAEEAASRSNQRTTTTTSAPPTNSPPKYPVPSSCNVYSGNKKVGCAVLVAYGFGLDQMPCLEKLWDKESHWNVSASNKSSGAYGIPQAVPGSKMATVGADWKTNPETQIRWGLNYIKSRYKTPCGAWSHSQSSGWY
ncbi:lytic transglycosylase domain-containing protein [Dactylosporangium sp. CA-092794]|uniref:aggregation-promoting factor C-terminal-like domain-containing protein n=1 Tax=Dactylosporangium sp. CA-092794 TaxID=3239929 RepID=UPI003D8D5680